MANIKDNVAAKETKRRLIDAAGDVFAEKGFERATIKGITMRAGVSLAAVNYHFSDKNELYYQCLRHAHSAAMAAVKLVQTLPSETSPPQRLRVFIRGLLSDMLDPQRPKWESVILWREMQQPTIATERLCSETFCEACDTMEALVASLVGRPIPEPKLRLIVESVLGQCLFHVHHQELNARIFPDEPPAHERVDELADHISNFSIAAIDSLFHGKSSHSDHNAIAQGA